MAELGSLRESIDKIPELVNKNHVQQMLSLQNDALIRIERTNQTLNSCQLVAQKKLVETNKLFKSCTRQIAESKKDLDVIYKKLTVLKLKIKSERPELYERHKEIIDQPLDDNSVTINRVNDFDQKHELKEYEPGSSGQAS